MVKTYQVTVPRHEYDALAAKNAALKARLAEAERERNQMREAILWACGERGEFPEEPPPLAGKYHRKYYWRTELRARAFGTPDGGADQPSAVRDCHARGGEHVLSHHPNHPYLCVLCGTDTQPTPAPLSAEEHCRMFCAWKGGGPCLADDCPRRTADNGSASV